MYKSDCAMLRYKMLNGAMTVDYRVQRVSCKQHNK